MASRCGRGGAKKPGGPAGSSRPNNSDSSDTKSPPKKMLQTKSPLPASKFVPKASAVNSTEAGGLSGSARGGPLNRSHTVTVASTSGKQLLSHSASSTSKGQYNASSASMNLKHIHNIVAQKKTETKKSASAAAVAGGFNYKYTCDLFNVEVIIHDRDIKDLERADVLICPAPHCMPLKNVPGMAGAVIKMAGRELEKFLANELRKVGHLNVGDVLESNAHNMANFRTLLLVAGPYYDDKDVKKCKQDLKMTFTNSFKKATELKPKIQSLAIAALGSGKFFFFNFSICLKLFS